MDTLGNWLRAAREAKSFSLQDVEASTRILARYVEALEAGDYGVMPAGEAQARGFLRRYATFLGLSAEEAILRYEQRVQKQQAPEAPPAEPPPPQPAAPTRPMPLARSPWRWIQLAIALLGVLVVILVGVWLVNRFDLFAGRQATPTAESAALASTTPADELGTAAIISATLLPPATLPPQPMPTFVVREEGGLTLVLESSEHVWVRVTADGFTAYEGMLAPGATPSWMADEMIVVETGNGAGVIASVNGQSQGALCGRGEVCARGWGPQGEIEVPPPSTGGD